MIPYVIALVVLGILDGVWLGLIAGAYYKSQLGPLLAQPIGWAPAIAFYLIYTAGLLFFVIQPSLESGGWQRGLLWGAGLGFVAYATYNLTCLSVIRGYPTNLALLDLAWGTVLSGLTAALTVMIAQRWS